MNLDISPKGVLKNLLYFIVFLLALNTLGVISKFFFNHDSVYGLIPLFDFDTEQNIPTFYSSVALLCASILLMVIARAHQKMGSGFLGWRGLSIIFLFYLLMNLLHSTRA